MSVKLIIVRIVIGKPKGNIEVSDYVLQNFDEDEILGIENFMLFMNLLYKYFILIVLFNFIDLSAAKQTDIKSNCSFKVIIGFVFFSIKISKKF